MAHPASECSPMPFATCSSAGVDRESSIGDVEVLHAGGHDEAADAVRPTLMAVSAAAILAHPELLEECFGPMSLLVEYDNAEQMLSIADALPGFVRRGSSCQRGGDTCSLTCCHDSTAHAGRVLWGGWPTGVAVTWSMQHGGPFPATTRPEIDECRERLRATVPPPGDLSRACRRRGSRPRLARSNPWGIPQRVDGVLG